ncbi:DUF453-domain-containing protein [Annulohypoxylon nitens]|nr:DUF453-domain-containing protein [Annulohypoxylon nitens]
MKSTISRYTRASLQRMFSSSAPPPTVSEAVRITRKFPATFVRGGTSTGLIIQRHHLPPQTEWPSILPAAMGAPDPYGRQLDGMGGGISSTSKVCVISASTRQDADVDFTFVQVGIKDGVLDLAGNCGNMSSAVGPVAWDAGLVPKQEAISILAKDGTAGDAEYREALVRIFNTNTKKIIHSRFRVTDSPYDYCPRGDYEMDGVPGTQSRITLSFLDPAGAATGKALPTGNAVDILTLPDGSQIQASLVDVSNPGVFIRIPDLGSQYADPSPETFTPQAVEADPVLKARLEAIRQAGARAIGLNPKTESVPKIVLLFPSPGSADVDIRCLALSMGQAHKAVPLTLALCLGAAANMPGTLPAQVRNARSGHEPRPVVIGHPSGTVEIGAQFKDGKIASADLLRTARILMKGDVYF